jgi:hypothetical protein
MMNQTRLVNAKLKGGGFRGLSVFNEARHLNRCKRLIER